MAQAAQAKTKGSVHLGGDTMVDEKNSMTFYQSVVDLVE